MSAQTTAIIYTLGRLGKHNVVIGTLPDGEYGIAAAVGVAKGMLSSFPNVRIGLMVGIGGGAPSLKNDIRLGDIVVSAPRNGHGGVFQYDFGKTIQDKKFQTVGILNQPPELLRAALTDIQAEYEMDGHQLQEMIDAALQQRPRLRQNYQRPNDSSDRLFQSGLVHRESGGADCMTNCYDGPSSLVQRLERTTEEDNPAIYYGTIASANQLMKDALVRDRLAAEEDVLCFEMEAAGLMNRFPCIVIRGICDYADSHTNKQWQGYAAMAAAAYAKDFLRRIPATKLEAERHVSVVLGSIDTNIKRIQSTATQVQSEIQNLHDSVLNAHQKAVLGRLRVAEGASFDSYAQEHNRYCLANTRVDLLHQITVWAKDKSAEPIFWLIGMAGTGKSTISRTVAKLFADKGQLGASFFFQKGEADRGNLSKFFMTIAADLVMRRPSISPHIEAVLNADRSIGSKNITEQFQKFLLEPLSKGDIRERPVVIVVDALDECEQDDINHFLYLVSRLETELPDRARIVLTSRPEEPFRSHFEKIKRSNSRVILHEISQPVIEHDIDVFLRYELSRIREEFNGRVPTNRHLTLDWPDQSSLDRLVKMAVPLFIVAATICRFVSDKKIGIPGKLLETVLSRSDGGRPQLETMYRSVLDNLTAGKSVSQREQIIQQFRQVVGSIVLLANPLSTSSLAKLLSMSKDDIDSRLDLMHSILSIPPAEAPVRLLHLSFRDFLLYSEEPTMPFRVDWKQTHENLVAHCLLVMECLKKDLCDINSPGKPRSHISSKGIDRYLPPEVQYSCQYWVYHFEEAGIFVSDGTDAHEFLQKHFLHWIEALALINRASESLGFLRTLRSRCKSKIRTIFEDSEDVAGWIRLKPKMEDYWNNCLQTLEGHSDYVSSVVFSPDATLVASGSHDETVRIWRADTGECLQTLAGHSDYVSSVVFSPNATLVASGSHDRTVRIWRADKDECTRTLQGHSGTVTSVVFWRDATLVASSSHDKTVRIWCADTGECEQTLRGHSGYVLSIVFLSNETLIASSSDDQTVRIWRANTGQCLQTLVGHSDYISSAVFSPNATLVASGSDDQTVRIWRANTGECAQTLEGHSDYVSSVVFSPDATLVASGSDDQTVRIWRADTGESTRTLQAHSDWVTSVVFSPDATLVASSSDDQTVRIWRADTGECTHTLQGHGGAITSVVFSPDATLVASSSDDQTVRIWHADTGERTRTLQGHGGAVTSMVFSPDATLVASGSDDQTVRIWHADTGKCMRSLQGHSAAVTSVVFSPDATLVASGSDDQTVRIWHADTGECTHTLQGHVGAITSVAFSPDATLVASGSDDQTVRIWHTVECTPTLHYRSDGDIMSVMFWPDAPVVASSSDDQTVRIWHADTGKCVRALNIGHASERLIFSRNGSYIITDVGAIAISGQLSMERSGIGINGNWITWDETNMLWLPAEFRRCCSSVSGTTVVIGSASGKVIMVGLSPDCSAAEKSPRARTRSSG